MQDVRGRYASDGEFRPYENEGRDGYDTIEWAARQPWSNGRVGTFGLSYPGAVQWLAAVESPPHLEAMVPAMTFSTPQNFFYSGGVWDLSWVAVDLAEHRARCARAKAPPGRRSQESAPRWSAVKSHDARDAAARSDRRSLRDIAPYYYDWLHHPPEDPFWNFAELRNKYDRTRAAVLNLSGWNDDNYGPEGAITNYLGLVAARAGQPSRTALLLGPWVHGVDSTARTKFGERDFGPAAAIDYDEVVLGWMDRYLRDDAAPGCAIAGAATSSWATTSGRRPTPGLPAAATRVYYLSSAAKPPTRGGADTARLAAHGCVSSFPSNPDDR